VSGALLIVNADDFGLTEGVGRAVLDAHRQGVVTSTSVLPVGPAFERTVGWLDDAPALGVGAHLCAVGEDPPLLSGAEIPTLVDPAGRLRASWRSFLPAMARGHIDPDDLRREFGAQLERLVAAGRRPDHLDTHQNVHLWPAVWDVVAELGEAHGVRAVRVPRARAVGVVGVVVAGLARRLSVSATGRGWVHPAWSTGLDEAGHLDRTAMISSLFDLAASGAATAELATHPGAPVDPDRVRYQWGYDWPEELAALCSAEVARAVAELGFRLGTFADLADGEGAAGRAARAGPGPKLR
jgi:predicted glycoside hydrolase/deacetylase ChbG (UPF0249 family)